MFGSASNSARAGELPGWRGAFRKSRDVVAGGEAFGGAGQQHGAYLRIGVGRGERVSELRVHLARDGVLLVERGRSGRARPGPWFHF